MKRVFHEILLVLLAFLRHMLCHTRNCDKEKQTNRRQKGGYKDDAKSD